MYVTIVRCINPAVTQKIQVDVIHNNKFMQAHSAVRFGADILESNQHITSRIYNISDVCGGQVHAFHETVLTQRVRCNIENEGWTVILRRKRDVPQPVNFSRSWNEYVQGFGDLNTEFWYGLRNIHCLTSRQQVDLQLLLNFTNGSSFLWTYHHFVVDRPEDKYILHIGKAVGPGGTFDTMAHNNLRPFSTADSDNDASSINCAIEQGKGSGWWFNRCNYCEITHPRPQIYEGQMLDYVEMRVRPKQCKS